MVELGTDLAATTSSGGATPTTSGSTRCATTVPGRSRSGTTRAPLCSGSVRSRRTGWTPPSQRWPRSSVDWSGTSACIWS